ncbi:MAG: 50S ribosomal protein L9 [Oscillospiraceae bacterium]|nr:50S ribosomal protein L9 [Oscillospiraceae bacterium]
MQVILKQDVKGLGKAGDMVKVQDGHARNFLLPRGIAAPVTAQTMAEMKNREAANRHKIEVEIQTARDVAAQLEGKTLKLSAKAGQGGKLFGSVTSKEIAAELETQFGIKADKRKITVEDIKQYGTYAVELRLYNGILAKLFVMVGE